MKPRHKRFAWIALGVVALGIATALVLTAFNKNLVFFFTPSQVAANEAPVGRTFRIGGMVEKGSVQHGAGAQVRFRVTDGKSTVPADFNGVLPALFREGQGVVATGTMNASGTFIASEVLAKHDEKYMPPAVVDALKRSGRWQEGSK